MLLDSKRAKKIGDILQALAKTYPEQDVLVNHQAGVCTEIYMPDKEDIQFRVMESGTVQYKSFDNGWVTDEN